MWFITVKACPFELTAGGKCDTAQPGAAASQQTSIVAGTVAGVVFIALLLVIAVMHSKYKREKKEMASTDGRAPSRLQYKHVAEVHSYV